MAHSVGNTKRPRDRTRNFAGTWNNPDENFLAQIIKLCPDEYAMQLEMGAQGTKHLQFVLAFKNPQEFHTMKKWLPKAHFEKVRSLKHAVPYCVKQDTRIDGPWVQGFKKYLPRMLKDLPPLEQPWHSQLWDSINVQGTNSGMMGAVPPNPPPGILSQPGNAFPLRGTISRRVIWVFDKTGGAGKSLYTSHMLRRPGYLCVLGKESDIKHAVANWLEPEKGEPKELHTVIIDIPRCEHYRGYSTIEQLKNGFMFSGKYNSKQILFDPVEVIVFANEEPDRSQLSEDRWNIFEIVDNKLTNCP